jgi:hypothetical protein
MTISANTTTGMGMGILTLTYFAMGMVGTVKPFTMEMASIGHTEMETGTLVHIR